MLENARNTPPCRPGCYVTEATSGKQPCRTKEVRRQFCRPKGKIEEEPRQILRETFEVINKVKDKALRQDLLVVMGILAGGKYAAELVYSLIRREMVMESPIYQEWVKEERIEAEARGRIEKTREAICKFMTKRFGVDSGETTQKIKQIPAPEILDSLMEELFAANTKEEAQVIIDRYITRTLQ